MSFWREKLIQPALDHETQRHIAEQRAWIEQEPGNPRPYLNLARLYRMENRPEEALGLLLEAVRLDDSCADAHCALAEMYAVGGDNRAAWRHARAAERNGNPAAVELLRRHRIVE